MLLYPRFMHGCVNHGNDRTTAVICPRCRTRLTRTKNERGVYFCCPQCHGRAIGLALLRQLGSNECVRNLWIQAREPDHASGAPCPLCRRAMAEVAASEDPQALRLDVCTGCQFVWFDPQEFEQFPAPEADNAKQLPEKAREIIAIEQLRRDAERRNSHDPGPDEWWQLIPGILGLPVEEEAPALQRWSWVTYGLAVLLIVVYILTARSLDVVIGEFGMIPAQLGRHGGITFFTSFFLHAGFWHLLGNVYFLVIFGDNVEDDLGHLGCLLLLAIAALVGALWHILGDIHSTAPAVGASGGISGVITYYALRFPRAKLGFLFRYWFYFRWIRIPAYVALLLWFLLQFFYVYEEQLGIGNIAAMAHLGGAAVGVVAWLLWRSDSLSERNAV